MNEQTENNKQTNCFLKIFIRKPISLPLEAIHVTLTGSSVKSAEHMAKINTKIKLILLVALGTRQTKIMYPFGWSCPSATFASQHGGFVPSEWQAVKGP